MILKGVTTHRLRSTVLEPVLPFSRLSGTEILLSSPGSPRIAPYLSHQLLTCSSFVKGRDARHPLCPGTCHIAWLVAVLGSPG